MRKRWHKSEGDIDFEYPDQEKLVEDRGSLKRQRLSEERKDSEKHDEPFINSVVQRELFSSHCAGTLIDKTVGLTEVERSQYKRRIQKRVQVKK